MTVSTLDVAMKRIETAEENSKIAVFTTSEPGTVQALFEGTIRTQALIKNKNSGYIGSYYKDDNQSKIKAKIRAKISR